MDHCTIQRTNKFYQATRYWRRKLKRVCVAIYTVVKQEAGTQGLVTSESRLLKKNLTIPRLELVAGHIAVNLALKVCDALQSCDHVVHCWLNSTVTVYWIQGSGECCQFIANQVQNIQKHQRIVWRHMPTDQNPADLGGRVGTVTSTSLWMNGPLWLSKPDHAANVLLLCCLTNST